MIYLVVQGALKPNAEPLYEQYLQRVAPLMREFKVEIVAVGAGVASRHASDQFPINAVMLVPDEETLERFLGDSRYQSIKREFRDRAYAELHLSVFRGRDPRRF